MIYTMQRDIAAIAAAAMIAFGLAGCGAKIDARQLEEKSGLFYKAGESDPFSGTVTHLDRSTSLFQLTGAMDMTALDTEHRLCTVSLKKGVIDGDGTCIYDNGTKANDYHFSDGKKDGSFKRFDNTGRLTYEAIWANDSLVSERDYVAEARKPHVDAQAKEFEAYRNAMSAPEFDDNTNDEGRKAAASCMRHRSAEYQQTHPSDATDADINAMQQALRGWVAECGKLASAPPAQTAQSMPAGGGVSVQVCVDAKVDAFRKANGSDAPIDHDTLKEWTTACGGTLED